MIKVNVNEVNGIIMQIEIKGHANFAVFGKDIVCASVSSIAITSINAILSLDENAIIVNESEGLLVIKKNNDNDSANKILKTLSNMLKDLADDYPKNIKYRNED